MSADTAPATADPLVEPPSLQVDHDRAASTLELFFDLAYVLVIAQLASALGGDLTWHGALVFAGLFAATWWSWVTSTLYANRFDTNDVPYRLAKLGIAFAVAMMAASAPDAVGTQSTRFALGYVVTRLLLGVLYARAFVHVRATRATTGAHLVGLALGVAAWSASLALAGPARYGLWALGVLAEVVLPLVPPVRRREAPLHFAHLPERFGLFVLLVLGESIASVVHGVHDVHWATGPVVAAAIGFVIASAAWWTYFDLGGAAARHELVTGGGEPDDTGSAPGFVFGHLPLTLGLAAIAVGIDEFVLHEGAHLAPVAIWALTGGTALYLAGTSMIIAGTAGRWRAAWPWPVLAVPLAVVVGVLGALEQVPVVATMTAVAALLVVTVVLGVRSQRSGHLLTETD